MCVYPCIVRVFSSIMVDLYKTVSSILDILVDTLAANASVRGTFFRDQPNISGGGGDEGVYLWESALNEHHLCLSLSTTKKVN